MLMAAAAAFAGNAAAPAPISKNVAAAVNQFVAQPVAHVPATGAVPGAEAHLPAGVDPAHAVGPGAGGAAGTGLPEAAPAPAPDAAARTGSRRRTPRGSCAAAPAPAPDAGGPAPAGAPDFGPDAPVTQDFMYPSISNGCLKDGGNVLATAISVAGPAKIPAPGPGRRPDGLRVHRDRHARARPPSRSCR